MDDVGDVDDGCFQLDFAYFDDISVDIADIIGASMLVGYTRRAVNGSVVPLGLLGVAVFCAGS